MVSSGLGRIGSSSHSSNGVTLTFFFLLDWHEIMGVPLKLELELARNPTSYYGLASRYYSNYGRLALAHFRSAPSPEEKWRTLQ